MQLNTILKKPSLRLTKLLITKIFTIIDNRYPI